MKIYVHAGTHKTGSTSIQDICFDNREELKNHGIYYPIMGNTSGHHELAFWLNDNKLEQANLYIKEQIKLAQLSNCDKLLLSSEEFEFIYKKEMISFFNKHGTTEIIFFFRRQDELIEKEYEQIVKMPNVRYDKDIFTFYLEKWFQSRINYQHIISLWNSHYKVHALSYDLSAYNNSLLTDFLSILEVKNLDNFTELNKRSNISPPSIVTIYLTRLNRKNNLSPKLHLKALNFLSQKFSCDKGVLLPKEIRKTILHRCQPINKKLFPEIEEHLFLELFNPKKHNKKYYIDYRENYSQDIYEELCSHVEKDENNIQLK